MQSIASAVTVHTLLHGATCIEDQLWHSKLVSFRCLAKADGLSLNGFLGAHVYAQGVGTDHAHASIVLHALQISFDTGICFVLADASCLAKAEGLYLNGFSGAHAYA